MDWAPISQQIWDMKYRLRDGSGSRRRRSRTPGGGSPAPWPRPSAIPDCGPSRFYEALQDFKFLPAGRILAGAGTGRTVTLFNCFVMGTIPDDMGGIFAHLREAALTMQQGGGIGYDFSTLRPQGAPVKGVGADASGPLSFMDVWDAMCRTIMSAGSRRGAMMATLRCDHPDIEAFIEAKREPGRLRMFNLSVLVTDAFMTAVEGRRRWPLVFGGNGLQDAAGARAVGHDHARDLRLRRARRDLHRPHQPRGTICTIARRSRRPIRAASSRCRPTAPACSARSIWRAGRAIRSPPQARLDLDGAGEAGAASPCA